MYTLCTWNQLSGKMGSFYCLKVVLNYSSRLGFHIGLASGPNFGNLYISVVLSALFHWGKKVLFLHHLNCLASRTLHLSHHRCCRSRSHSSSFKLHACLYLTINLGFAIFSSIRPKKLSWHKNDQTFCLFFSSLAHSGPARDRGKSVYGCHVTGGLSWRVLSSPADKSRLRGTVQLTGVVLIAAVTNYFPSIIAENRCLKRCWITWCR